MHSGQRTELALALAGLAWLQARRGRASECRQYAAEALGLGRELGMGLNEVWATAALGELELGLGEAARAAELFEKQQDLLTKLGITDADLWPAADLADAYVRLGRDTEARAVAAAFSAVASAKGQPWSAAEAFERLDARPWAERARAELAATGETLRRRDPSAIEELTPQELQIAVLLAAGRTTRETAAALFLSPKTVEYHLRHVYQKLGIHSREELAQALASSAPRGG